MKNFFPIIVGNFALLDPDPADKCGSVSETLVLREKSNANDYADVKNGGCFFL